LFSSGVVAGQSAAGVASYAMPRAGSNGLISAIASAGSSSMDACTRDMGLLLALIHQATTVEVLILSLAELSVALVTLAPRHALTRVSPASRERLRPDADRRVAHSP
jgi:hypothetical protein